MKEYKDLYVREKKVFWKENPLNGEIDITIDGFTPFKMYCENDDTVVKELYWTKFAGWELTSLKLWRDLLAVNNGKMVYDIGSYSGIYSLIASKHSDDLKIYAFDIQDNCIERLGKNIAINEMKNIEVTLAACADMEGTTTFYFYEEDGIISSVAGLKPNEMNNKKKEVKAIVLDKFHKESTDGSPVGLMKIDVEGAEKSTLKGLEQTLKSFSPDVLIEVNNPEELKGVKKFFPSGYKVYDIDEDANTIKKLGLFSKPSKYRNYLFTKRSGKELASAFSGIVK